MHFSQNQGIEDSTFVVTGGLGFVGSHLCLDLVRRGARQVRAFDLRPTSLCYQECDDISDVARKKDVDKALRGADCVFHLASYGMSGKEILQFGRVDEVNISGTCLVLEACLEFEIRRLVYVSTYGVVFGGNEIVNGNESLPFFPVDDHVDPYGRSKSIAERLVLKHNARPFKKNNGKCLFTCAIRPAAIYGPGEERHFPRIVSFAKLGLLPFKIGSPISTFEFLQPLLKSLDYDLPKASLSVPRVLMLGRIFWAIYTVLYPWLNRWWLPQPLILPAEVYKEVGVTHYFSSLKARQELGCVPMVSPQEGMAATISYWQERKRKTLDGPTIYARLFVVTGITSVFSAAYLPDMVPAVSLLRATSQSHYPYPLPINVGCENNISFSHGRTYWRGCLCMEACKEGGSC
ncbi:hypothetical protein POTOM_009201 [Populus tomentosa]|uniref:3-beta hydroxysteroid dehydrogenase/isomerase domain-containing protein n=1 Tax=Populus tomentosa TaxID=118781 RepID=A0A8X8DA15_POPTO|nr:hypothetical protein POTOM_009201 [Populus tomentosa]